MSDICSHTLIIQEQFLHKDYIYQPFTNYQGYRITCDANKLKLCIELKKMQYSNRRDTVKVGFLAVVLF